jgi:TPR repeat protein
MKNQRVVRSFVAGAVPKALVILAIIGCSSLAQAADPPTENQGANAMAAKIQDESKGLLRLVKFTKTNGQKANANGIEKYTMDCTAETIAVQACALTGFGVGGRWDGSFGAMKAQKNANELDKFNPFGGAYAGNKQLAKDAKMTFTTTLEFEMTERGWRTEGRIAEDKPFVAGPTGRSTSRPSSTTREAADAGDPEGMYRLGRMYYEGRGVAKDAQEAVKWFRKAADAGNGWGMFFLGVCYHNGDGVTKDDQQAVMWLKKAADANNDMAMCDLGSFYHNGDGVTKDDQEAFKWYQKAADAELGQLGMSRAIIYLGECYHNGWGVAKDDQQAFKCFQRSANAGNTEGMNDLAWVLLTCEDVKHRDPATALSYAQKAVSATARTQPGALDTLALAFFQNGRVAEAVETQREAISLIPAGHPSRKSLEARLIEFQNATQTQPVKPLVGEKASDHPAPQIAIKLKDGTAVKGTFAPTKFKFITRYGQVEVSSSDIISYADGLLTLSDKSTLKGTFVEGSPLKVLTAHGELSTALNDIVGISTELVAQNKIEQPGGNKPAAEPDKASPQDAPATPAAEKPSTGGPWIGTLRVGGPATVTDIKQGQTQIVSVVLFRSTGFNMGVKLEMKCPTGLQIVPNSTTVKPGDDNLVMLTLTAAKDAPIGESNILVKGTPDKGESASIEIKVNVIAK